MGQWQTSLDLFPLLAAIGRLAEMPQPCTSALADTGRSIRLNYHSWPAVLGQ